MTPIAHHLAARTGANEDHAWVAERDLERNYALFERELTGLSLSEQAWNLLRDALNGTLIEACWTAATLADALEHGLGVRWGLSTEDEQALLRNLRALSPGQAFAVLDAVERWWIVQDTTT